MGLRVNTVILIRSACPLKLSLDAKLGRGRGAMWPSLSSSASLINASMSSSESPGSSFCIYPHAKADLGERHKVFIGLMHVYFFSLWLYHLYGYEGYRDHLTRAVRGLIYILARSQDVNGKSTHQTRQIEHTLCRVLTHQLDWSLDDLPLDDIERQIVDTLLAEVNISRRRDMLYGARAGFY